MEEQVLYQKHTKIRPRPVKGKFNNLRITAVIILVGFFHILPLLTWNGRQAVLFDLVNRRFFIFGLNIWPQDFILLSFTLIGLGLILFFSTALFGRIWCGYACPHTIYTQIFMWIEQKIQGNRSEQLKLSRLSWKNKEKQKKVGLTLLAWFVVALISGLGFTGYFTPMKPLLKNFFTFNASFNNYFWVFAYGGFIYLQAGLVREQFCKYMCPYARFQGAMFDKDTVIIAYDEKRGEPRRKLKRTDRENNNLGFCVDCSMCVQVCPTGIDIRKGLQMECIACAACIDACNNMMRQIKAPEGLIRYSSSNALAGNKTKFWRPKTFGYALILSLFFTAFLTVIITKSNVDLDVIADRNMLSRPIGNGLIQNAFMVKVLNKSENDREFILNTRGIEGAIIENNQSFKVKSSEVYELVISINAPENKLNGLLTNFYITISSLDNPNKIKEKKAIFTGKL